MKHEPITKEWEEYHKRYAEGLRILREGTGVIQAAMMLYSGAVRVKHGVLATINWDTGEIETKDGNE